MDTQLRSFSWHRTDPSPEERAIRRVHIALGEQPMWVHDGVLHLGVARPGVYGEDGQSVWVWLSLARAACRELPLPLGLASINKPGARLTCSSLHASPGNLPGPVVQKRGRSRDPSLGSWHCRPGEAVTCPMVVVWQVPSSVCRVQGQIPCQPGQSRAGGQGDISISGECLRIMIPASWESFGMCGNLPGFLPPL